MTRRIPRNAPIQLKSWLDVTQSALTISAIVAGVVWFYMQRFDKPMVKLEHIVTQRPLVGSPHHWLVILEIRVTNVGKVRVNLDQGEMELLPLNPPLQENAPLVILDSEKLRGLTLEPGETDQALFTTFDFPDGLKTIQVHSDYRVPTPTYRYNWELFPTPHQDLYWNLLTAFDLGNGLTRTTSTTGQMATTK